MRVTASLLFALTISLGAQSAPPGTRNYTRLDATVACAGATSVEAIPAIHIPFSGTDPQTEAVDQFLTAVKDPANSPVFIHCGSGNRAGMMWLVKRVMVDGWPLDKATFEIERAGLGSPELKGFALRDLKAHGKA